MLISSVLVVLLHDNARPHTAARTRAPLEHFNWELFDHLPYSPNLALSDYHLFTYLKRSFGSQGFNNNEELMQGVKTWLISLAAGFFNIGIQKLIPRHDSASVPPVTTLRSSLRTRMYILFNIIHFFSLLAFLTAHRRLLS
jgi:hypothetical protein